MYMIVHAYTCTCTCILVIADSLELVGLLVLKNNCVMAVPVSF